MKLKNLVVFYFLFIPSIIFADGFAANTLVATPQGLLPIEVLSVHDSVISKLHKNDLIINTQHFISDYHVIISISDFVLCAAPHQKFYSATRKQWIEAKYLQPSECLLCIDASTIAVDRVELINAPKEMYSLSIETNHSYCVTPYKIIAHNFDPVSSSASAAILSCICPPIAPVIITAQATIGAILAGIGLYFTYKKHTRTKTFAQIQEEVKNNSLSPGPKKPDDDDDENEHPHGIYNGAGYHHFNSKYDKSPSPNNGQRCLDYSLYVNEGTRISIENNTFVILRRTLPGEFHGYATTWKQLCQSMQTILRKQGYITKAGKIIKEITTKALK